MRVRASDATCGKRERGWGAAIVIWGEEGEREGLSFNVRAFRKCLSVFLVNAIIQVLVLV